MTMASNETDQEKTDKERDSTWSKDAQTNDIEEVNALLRSRSKRHVTAEHAVLYHDSEKIALPAKPKKMTYAEGAAFLAKQAEAEEEMYEFGEESMCRPMD